MRKTRPQTPWSTGSDLPQRRWITGGGGPRGFLMTSLFGSAGALAGGAFARTYHLPQYGAGGFLMSVIGAIVVLALLGALAKLFRR